MHVELHSTCEFINPQRACAVRVTVGVCVCVYVCVHVSVKSHLTSGVSVRPENTVHFSAFIGIHACA